VVLMGRLRAAAQVAVNRLRARMRVARARRILDLENTRRRYFVIGLLIAWWLAGIGSALATSAGR
jgi:membrane protein YqaA with SNARE-associated domain